MTKLTASDAQDNAQFGNSVAVSSDTAVVGARFEEAGGNDAGAAYVFRRDEGGAGNWGEVKKLTASDAQAGDFFGWSVAVSGDTAVLGALLEAAGGANAGAAYIFQRDQGGADNWGEVKKLNAFDVQAGARFGASVAASGDTAVVGATLKDVVGGPDAAGAAYVFRHDQGGANNWGQVTKLTASDPQGLDQFGNSVAVSDDTVLVGASFKDSLAGAAYVFQQPAPAPTPTNTPTSTPVPPTPIGGIGIFPELPGGGPDTGGAAVLSWLAAGAAASAIALGGAWYARRRQQR